MELLPNPLSNNQSHYDIPAKALRKAELVLVII